MTDHWTGETIRSELEATSRHLQAPVTAYLIGGSAMVVRGLKQTTPDIDLLVPSESDFDRLQAALEAAGHERTQLRKSGDDNATTSEGRFVDNGGREIDVFGRQVRENLVLSKGIERRSELYLDTALATISVISPEDIYLSKLAHSGRPKDTGDTTALSSAGLDFDVVREELSAQNDLVEKELPNLLLFGRHDET